MTTMEERKELENKVRELKEKGYSNVAIADRLSLKESTVRAIVGYLKSNG